MRPRSSSIVFTLLTSMMYQEANCCDIFYIFQGCSFKYKKKLLKLEGFMFN